MTELSLLVSLEDEGADVGARVSQKMDEGVGLLEGSIALHGSMHGAPANQQGPFV